MKKSKVIQLVLVASVFSSCDNNDSKPEKKVYMRSDTTANYSRAHGIGYHGSYYFAFRPYGVFGNQGYTRAGYYSSAIHENANVGRNGFKSSVVRGGFGSSTFHVSS
jgi:hypothetical protein